jgi:hypothetical protein
MSDSSDVKDALIDNLKDGIVEKQIGDRRYRYHDPRVVLDAIKQLAADEANAANASPFLKVHYPARSI